MEIAFFHWPAVLVCIISNMVIGALWYSPVLFGTIWLKLVNRQSGDIDTKEARSSMALSIIPAILSVLTLAVLLGLTGASTPMEGILVASLVSVGFVGMSALNLVFFENRSLALTLLNTGYFFTALNVAALILTLWK